MSECRASSQNTMENCERFPLGLLFFLVYEPNEFFTEAFVSTRNSKI